MYNNISHDRFNPGTDLTAYATAPVVGKTFAAYSGPIKSGNISIATAAAGAAVAGVIKYDADTADLVGIARGSSRVITVTAGDALTPGAAVEVGPNGKAIPAVTGVIVGYAVDTAAANTDALILLAN